MSKSLLTIAFIIAVANSSSSRCGRLFISESASRPTANENPTISLDVGRSTSMYVWVELSLSESIKGLAFDVINMTSDVVIATTHDVDNPNVLGINRWSVINPGTLGELITDSNFVNVGGGLNGDLTTLDPLFDEITGSYRVSRIDIESRAPGRTEVFLEIGSAGIALGAAGDPIFLGWGDVSIANNAIGISSSLPEATIIVQQKSIIGDFDHDGTLGVADINLLIHHVGMRHLAFDITDDGIVSEQDILKWVNDLANTWFGDSNLDGEFSSSDLIGVFQAGKYELEIEAAWDEGDWTGDLRFNTTDLIAAFQDGGYEQGPRAPANAVPEPASRLWLIAALIGLAFRPRHVGP